MIEFPWNYRWNYESWFYFDEGSFPDESQYSQSRIKTYKSAGRDSQGRLVLHHQVYSDISDWRRFTSRTYEISFEEFAWFLDRAISQNKADPEKRDEYLKEASSDQKRSWNIHFNMIVYLDERYALFQEREKVFVSIDGKCYRLFCYPYEPITYIDMGSGSFVSIHNAFDPYNVIKSFAKGYSVRSISGKEYDAEEFCKMLEFMIDHYTDTDISYLEGAMAVKKLKELSATSPETAVKLQELGVRTISDNFSHSRSLDERVMYTDDGKVYLRIKENTK